tara:strand:+ start:256 stop:873 length:618 start_codon:yes stop_codon:yes gene_type:complete
MYALVESGTITKYFSYPKGFTLGELQYPADIFMKWSVEEKEAIGIYEVVFNSSNFKDEQWYINTNQSFAFADGTVTASYDTAIAKSHADSLWTQQDSDDGNLPDDKSVGDVRGEGLKTTLIRTLKSQVAGILKDTDWYVIRNSEKSTAIPSSISTHRDAVRTKQAAMEAQITGAADTAALEILHTYTTTDGVQSRPLGELPVLES